MSQFRKTDRSQHRRNIKIHQTLAFLGGFPWWDPAGLAYNIQPPAFPHLVYRKPTENWGTGMLFHSPNIRKLEDMPFRGAALNFHQADPPTCHIQTLPHAPLSSWYWLNITAHHVCNHLLLLSRIPNQAKSTAAMLKPRPDVISSIYGNGNATSAIARLNPHTRILTLFIHTSDH